MNGFLLVDKAGGMTSHDVVAKMRKRFGTKRVGHAGTLDPMATGVLVLGVGQATRLLQYVTDGSKGYDATLLLGVATHTDDKEGEVIFSANLDTVKAVSEADIRAGLMAQIGAIKQRPSSVSAIKIDGKPAHQRIREGEILSLPEREVLIEKIDVHEIRFLDSTIEVDISVRCSAGTYIRAIARDLGEKLNLGGHLISLRRTLVSPFSLDETEPMAEAKLIPIAEGISRIFPIRSFSFDEMNEISFGRYLVPKQSEGLYAGLSPQGEFAALVVNKVVSDKHNLDVVRAAPILVAVKE